MNSIVTIRSSCKPILADIPRGCYAANWHVMQHGLRPKTTLERMGPLVAIAIAASALLVLAASAFVVALVRHSWRHAALLAGLFAVGFAAAVAGAAALSAFALGIGPTLQSWAGVLAYLSCLAVAGLLGGSLAWRWYAKRSNPSLQRTAFGVR
jgi:hypothetical protein